MLSVKEETPLEALTKDELSIVRKSTTQWIVTNVKSGTIYAVNATRTGILKCTCPGFLYRATCKHVDIVVPQVEWLVRWPRQIVRELLSAGDSALLPLVNQADGCSRWMVCGSYRREEPTCKDVDLVVECPETEDWLKLSAALKTLNGWETENGGSDQISGWLPIECDFNQYAYNGVSAFGYRKSRIGVDITRVACRWEWAACTLYRTGNRALNVKMRQLAKDRGWLLNQHGLHDADGNLIGSSNPVESDIFEALGLEFLDPFDRSISD